MDRLKSAGGMILGLLFLLAFVLLSVAMLFGIAWVTERVFPWVARVSGWVLVADIVLLPMLIFRRARPVAAVGYTISSWTFGLTNWMFGLLVTYKLWGLGAVIVGLIIMGVGVVPVGMLAAIFHGQWEIFWSLIWGVVLWIGTLIAAAWAEANSGPKLATEAR